MRTILFLLQKEFLQIFRDRAMVAIIFVMPLIQLIVLANAATYEVKDIRVSLIDRDQSITSRQLVDHMEASGYFRVVNRSMDQEAADHDLLARTADLIVHIPSEFERELERTGVTSLQLIFNAEDGKIAGVMQAYTRSIISRYNQQIQTRFTHRSSTVSNPSNRIEIVPASWFNPDLDYQTFMVPGILVLLVTMIGTFLTAMNIVREKEIGTIEQLNVSPIGKYQFIAGKLTPFWIVAMLELAFGLVVAEFLFEVPMLGSIPLIFGLAAVYLLAVLGLGLWISTVTNTQQQAMFIAWFFMVIFILMSGLFTPIESMPIWAQYLTELNPVAHFIEIMRRVLLKGAGTTAIQKQLWTLIVMAVVLLSLAIRQYRKVGSS